MDINWFLNWKCYVKNDITEKIIPNSKKNIKFLENFGYFPPSNISNENLFEDFVSICNFWASCKYLLFKYESFRTFILLKI